MTFQTHQHDLTNIIPTPPPARFLPRDPRLRARLRRLRASGLMAKYTVFLHGTASSLIALQPQNTFSLSVLAFAWLLNYDIFCRWRSWRWFGLLILPLHNAAVGPEMAQRWRIFNHLHLCQSLNKQSQSAREIWTGGEAPRDVYLNVW